MHPRLHSQGRPGVDQREHRQAHRIYNGVQNGSFSFNEAWKPIKGQVRVRAMERQFKSDGVVTPWERARLHHALNRQNAHLHQEEQLTASSHRASFVTVWMAIRDG